MALPAWLGGAAIIGTLAVFWEKVKWVINRVTSLFVVRIQLERELARAIALYCWKTMRRGRFGSRTYASFHEFVRTIHRNQVVAFESIGSDPIVFWKGWLPMLLGTHNKSSHGDDAVSGPGSSYGKRVIVTFIRGTFNIDKLVIAATDMFNDSLRSTESRKRFYVEYVFGKLKTMYDPEKEKSEKEELSTGRSVSHLAVGDRRILKWKLNELGPEQAADGNALGWLVFPPEIDEIILEAKHWLASEQWYRDRGVPWKRGWLLYGPTGTGKTALVRALGQDLDMPVWVYDVASLSNEELQAAWRRMLTRVPCIALMEDLDNIFEERKNAAGEYSIMTFDALLNVLDGVEPANGVFIVVTTNRIDKLDRALGVPRDGDTISTRPGRVDRVMHLKELDDDCRLRMATRMLYDCPEYIPATVDTGNGDTGAQFQERCLRIASDEYWKSKDLSEDVEIQSHERPVVLEKWSGEPVEEPALGDSGGG